MISTLLFFLMELFFRLIALLPYRLIYFFGGVIGRLLYYLAPRRAHIARINIQSCFPELSKQEVETLTKKNCISAGIGLLEVACCWYMSKSRFRKIFTVEGLENIAKPHEEGKPVIMLGFHFTGLEMGGSIVADYVPQVAPVYRSHANPHFERIMRKGRLRRAAKMIRREEVRASVKWLKSGGVLWYAMDQDLGSAQSVFIPFKGVPAATITGTSKLVRMTGALVVPLVQHRLPWGRGVKVVVNEPLHTIKGEDEKSDCLAINAYLESKVDLYPEDYMWFHRRFKTRPPGYPSLYPVKERVKIGIDTIVQIKKSARERLVDNSRVQIYRMHTSTLNVLLFRKSKWLPLTWFSPVPELKASLRNRMPKLTIRHYHCKALHTYLLSIDFDEPSEIESIIEFFQGKEI